MLALLGSPLATAESPQSVATIKPLDPSPPVEMSQYGPRTELALPPRGLRLVDQGRTTAILKSSRGFRGAGSHPEPSGRIPDLGERSEPPLSIWNDFIAPGKVQYNSMVEATAQRETNPFAIQTNQFVAPEVQQTGAVECRLNDHAFEAKETLDSIPLLPPKPTEPSHATEESHDCRIKCDNESIDEERPKVAVLPPELLRPRVRPLMVAPAGENSAIRIPQITPFESAPETNAVAQVPEKDQSAREVLADPKVKTAREPEALADPLVGTDSESWVTFDSSSQIEELITAPPRLLKVPPPPTAAPPTAGPPTADMALPRSERPKTEVTRPVVDSKLGDVRLTVDEQRQVPLGNATRVLVENQDLCDAAIVQGNLFLVPKKSGTCRVTVWRGTEKNPGWLQLTIDGASVGKTYLRDLQPIQQLVYRTFPDAAIRVSTQGDGLLVSGIVGNRDQAKEIMQLVRGACLCPVKDNLQVQTR
jgi:hypothetical protein